MKAQLSLPTLQEFPLSNLFLPSPILVGVLSSWMPLSFELMLFFIVTVSVALVLCVWQERKELIRPE